MQSKKKQLKTAIKTIRREIPDSAQNSPEPGEIGRAAVEAAALRQLDRCAKEIESFLEASKMETIIDKLQKEVAADQTASPPHLRIARE